MLHKFTHVKNTANYFFTSVYLIDKYNVMKDDIMNTISFTPINTMPNSMQVSRQKNAQVSTVSFQGGQQLLKEGTAKSGRMATFLYNLFFVPKKEKLVSMGENTVQTVSKKGKTTTIRKEYPKWSKTPTLVEYTHPKHRTREIIVSKGKGRCDYELQDISDPNFKTSVEYKNLTHEDYLQGTKIDSMVLNYEGKTVSINDEERKVLLDEMNANLKKRFYDKIDLYFFKEKNYQKTLDVSNEMYQDPEYIAYTILKSPSTIKGHTKKVGGCVPYGIEFIVNKFGK